ncbi:gephyrin-like molybdotransferase Glp [Cellulosimicrobium sp. NPDC057127]|uniref:molybdopterin molybdotransferase MoeA n=1 Tax=Cellulosimicrobium sp. NPDC057127 TaxID=3346026 RepID=UPI00362AE3B1
MAERVSVEQHQADVAALLAPLVDGARRRARSEEVALADALDRVLATDLLAPHAVPRFRNSQMDGYAVRACDVADAAPGAPVRLPVLGEVPAGPGAVGDLAPGAAARIMTGAPVPGGADAVVPVEDTATGTFVAASDAGGARGDDAAAHHVDVLAPRAVGDFVRESGSDVGAGDVVLGAGTVLAPHHLAAAAACGVARVRVLVRPRVAVLSTGAELVAPGEEPGPGQVFDANGPALAAAVRRAGGVVTTLARSGDDAGAFTRALAAATADADLVLTSGGVSQGAYEVVKDVLGGGAGGDPAAGVVFRAVAMQPGGPQGFGTVDGTPVLTFPGNPVSAQVSFVVFLRDVLEQAAGRPRERPVGRARVVDAGVSPAGRRQLLRGVRSPDGGVRLVGGPGSHLVASMARADVLVDVPADVTGWDAGTQMEVWEL